ncbi:MAG: hypothetical protein N2645_21595 [Clostridia bacterium]|nr:hypothetical protein [Clostridia bacterium]
MKKMTKAAVFFLILASLMMPLHVYAECGYPPKDSFESAEPIEISGMHAYAFGTMEAPEDEDFYRFTSSTVAFISLESPEGKIYDAYLYDKEYNLMSSTCNSNYGSSIIKRTVPGQVYFIKVKSRDGSFSRESTYRLLVSYKIPFV